MCFEQFSYFCTSGNLLGTGGNNVISRLVTIYIFTLVHLSLITVLLADSCEDRLTDCSTYATHCGNSLINRNCPRTCDVCPTDPCSVNNGGCDHLCNSTGSSVTCGCFSGFVLNDDERTCRDFDECTEGPNPCFLGLPAFCVNTVGSFSCEVYRCESEGTMNYYRNNECCRLRNGTCGITASIRAHLEYSRQLNSPVNTRILNGADAAAYAWPWMAQILYRGSSHCGGTLVADRWLVSAAHCFARYDSNRMFVYLGQIRNAHLTFVDTTNRVQRRISRVIIHSEYVEGVYYHDIALVELNEAVPTNQFISPLCLPCGEVPNEGDKCWVTGFGVTEEGGDSPATLQEVDVPIVDHETCRQVYSRFHPIEPEQMMCAGYPEGGKDSCIGDSGGPLACQRADSCEWYLSGIVSFGRGCGLAGYYGVYANVVNYESWIKETLGQGTVDMCARTYNPCRGYSNNDHDCYEKLERCETFPHYMRTNCKLACCQLENEEITNCRDGATADNVCETYKQYCSSSVFESFMRENCAKTCNFC